MSRCGSCPIYDRTKFGVHCDGNQGVEECASSLQSLYWAMLGEIDKLKAPQEGAGNEE